MTMPASTDDFDCPYCGEHATDCCTDGALADAMVLHMLADNGGALLHWHVSALDKQLPGGGVWQPTGAFLRACERGVIRLDQETDCYVHPLAVGDKSRGFTVPVIATKLFRAEWQTSSAHTIKFGDATYFTLAHGYNADEIVLLNLLGVDQSVQLDAVHSVRRLR